MKRAFYLNLFALCATGALSQEPEHRSLTLSGYAELYYSYDLNRPANHQQPAFLYSFNRHDEVNLNFGTVQLHYEEGPVRGNFALMAGTYVTSNLVSEPDGLKNVYEANAGIRLSKKHNIWIDAGIMPSHIGFESAVGANVATLTRSIQAENSPYFSTGVKLGYTSRDSKWMLNLYYLNGWQRIKRVDGSSMPSFGHQLVFTPNSSLTVNSSSLIGQDTADNLRKMRYFHNLYAVFHPLENTTVTAGLDTGWQQANKQSESYDFWYSPILVVRYMVNDKWSTTVRAESYIDEKEVIISTGTPNGFKTWGVSANVDHKIGENVLWRTEIRSFKSKDPVFSRNGKNVSSDIFATTSVAIKF